MKECKTASIIAGKERDLIMMIQMQYNVGDESIPLCDAMEK